MRFRGFSALAVALFPLALSAQQKTDAAQLIEMVKRDAGSPATGQAIIASLGQANIQKGMAFASQGPDFVFAVDSTSPPALFIDDMQQPPMKKLSGSNVWVGTAHLKTGWSHTFHYVVEGKPFGGNLNVPALEPESYPQPGVPEGKLSAKIVHSSKIYDGMESDYWVDVPPKIRPQDTGGRDGLAGRTGPRKPAGQLQDAQRHR